MKKAVKDRIISNLMDGCVLRIARYQYACAGDGTPNAAARKYSYVCVNTIRPRDKYIEFEPQPHSAGSRHCISCAEAFLAREWKADVEVRVKRGVEPYGGRIGKLVSRGERPDGRIYWETYLYLSGSHSTPVTREYYEDELELR